MSRSIDEYLAYLAAVRSLSPRTVDSYRKDLVLFEAACTRDNLDPATVDTADIRSFVAWMVGKGYAPASVNRMLSAVKGYFRYLARYGREQLAPAGQADAAAGPGNPVPPGMTAVHAGHSSPMLPGASAVTAHPGRVGSPVNPAADVEGLPNPRTLPTFLFEDEMQAFIDLVPSDGFTGSRDRALFETLYSTGCRVSELAGLDLATVDLAAGRAKVRGKGSRERIVFLSPAAAEAIQSWLPYRAARLAAEQSQTALFINARGGRLTTRGIAFIIEGYATRMDHGRRLSPHGFRHSFATHVLAGGADIRIVQELLGHGNISTTQIYTHVDVDRLKSVYRNAHPHAGRRGAVVGGEAS